MITVLNDKERSILSIAKTLHNVHGPRFFMVDAYLSMSARQYHVIIETVEALVSYELLEWKDSLGGGGMRITEAGLDYLRQRGEE